MDPTLTRLLECPFEDLTVADMVFVLGRCTASVKRTLERDCFEHKRHTGRGEAARGITATKTALIVHLVRITRGDRVALLAAIAAQCPQYLPAAQIAAQSKTIQAPTPAPAEPLPDNVVCITTGTRKRRPAADPYKDCPELFPITEITRPSQTA